MTAWKKRFRLIYSAFDVPYSLHNFPIHPIFPINLRDAAWKKFHVTLIFDKYIYIIFFFSNIYKLHARYVYDFFLQDQSSIRFRMRSKVSASKYFLPFPAMTRFSFFLSHLSIYPFSYDRAKHILENFRGAPMYRQNKVIERENRAQQIYSMRNICVRMCLYIYRER